MQKSGAKIINIDKDASATAEALSKKIDYSDTYEIDITNFDQVKKTIETVNDKYSKIDIFVNNAGIAGPSFKTWEYPNEDWQEVINIDLNGTFNCCKAIVPHMINKNYGRIVNVASIAGKERPKCFSIQCS